jgi:hypothetical protein
MNEDIQNMSLRQLNNDIGNVMGRDFYNNFNSPIISNEPVRDSSNSSMSSSNGNMFNMSMADRCNSMNNDDNNEKIYKHLLFNTIRNHCPKDIQDEVFKDVMDKINNPKNGDTGEVAEYDTMKKAEYILFERQAKLNKEVRIKRINNIIRMFIHGVDWITKIMKIEWFNFKDFKVLIEQSIDDGEFSDCTNGIEEIAPDKILDNPFVGVVTTIMTKACKAQYLKEEDIQLKLEREQEEKIKVRKSVINDMRMTRENAMSVGSIFTEQKNDNSVRISNNNTPFHKMSKDRDNISKQSQNTHSSNNIDVSINTEISPGIDDDQVKNSDSKSTLTYKKQKKRNNLIDRSDLLCVPILKD